MKNLTEYLKESLEVNEVSMELIQRAHAKAKGAQKNRIAKLARGRLEQILADGEANGGSVEKASKKCVYFPKTKVELKALVYKLIEERGENADLNDIDTSKINDMSHVFSETEFDGDISKWDVSKVEDMRFMFEDSQFNGDISKWDVSKVKSMWCMFENSHFNGDISKWDVRNVTDMENMFKGCPLESNPPAWYKG